MANLLKDKICLITGCAQGIGKGIMELFLDEGAYVYANDLNSDKLEDFKNSLDDEKKDKIEILAFDITDSAKCKDAIMYIKTSSSKLDILVNNAGIMKDALIGMISDKDIRSTFDVNVFSIINMIQLASKIMIRQNNGSIINLASIVGLRGNVGQMVYSASKGAVISLTKTASKELAKYNIRVNALAPGMIDTDMFKSIGEDRMKERLDMVPLGRLGTGNDVAKAALFLASDLSEYVTGQILGVDGAAII